MRRKASICIGLFTALAAAAVAPRMAHDQTVATSDAPAAALYETSPKERGVNRFAGSTVWRTEMVSPGSGLAPELAVKADVTIPKRGLTMSWSIWRNSDSGLPATHVIDIVFKAPANAAHGKIIDISPIHMKQGESTTGVALAGAGAKVTDGFFRIGLSSIQGDVLLNRQLLAERAWLDVGFLYEDGTRGMIALEKGDTGKRAFAEAFAAWAKPAPVRLR
jgi:hypothetical protein